MEVFIIAKLDDLTGKKFNMLKVVKRVENSKSGCARWQCECDCGNTTIVQGSNLKNGAVKSCGCLISKRIKETCGTHLQSKTRLYGIWGNMIQRCTNPNCKSYKNYGLRKIMVCDDWKKDFNKFYKWAITNGYSENLTIERKNTNKGYTPENCTWISKSEQAKNREFNLKIFYKNETNTLAEWCRKLNLNYKTIYMRIWGYKWSVEKAFETPIKNRR